MVEEARVEVLPRLRHVTAEQPSDKAGQAEEGQRREKTDCERQCQLHEAYERDDELYEAARFGITARYELRQLEPLDQEDAVNVAIADTASAPSTTSSSERI